jgi:hypothetical protein
MKLLMLHCREIGYKTRWENKNLEKGLMVLIGSHSKDKTKIAYEAVKEIVKTARYTKENSIVLTPFHYFSDKINEEHLELIAKELKKAKYGVETLNLADCTETIIDIMGHRVSVGYRELTDETINNNLQKTAK